MLALCVRLGGTGTELRLASTAGKTADGACTGVAAPSCSSASALQGRKGQPANHGLYIPALLHMDALLCIFCTKNWEGGFRAILQLHHPHGEMHQQASD